MKVEMSPNETQKLFSHPSILKALLLQNLCIGFVGVALSELKILLVFLS